MFSLPIVSSGMWFSWSLLLLAGTWFCMYHSSLFILEANLNYQPGASFDTFVKDLLGWRWNLANGVTLAFVLYILTYAYISGGGSIVGPSLERLTGIHLPGRVAALVFALGLASFVWFSTALVGRLTTILVAAMVITFLITASGLVLHAEIGLLLANRPEYALFTLAAVPYFLTSFGYHGCVPSLVKHYRADARRIRQCLLYGSLISLATYTLWHVATLGNIPRGRFPEIIASGGNIGDLVAALDAVTETARLQSALNLFANLAVVSSFLGVTLGLFDFIADKFKFADTRYGRLQTAALTFLPPTVGGVFFPNGFIHAIGLAGLCACIWGTIVPALAASSSRKKFGSPHYRVWGGNYLINFIIAYGVLLVICYLAAALKILPVYS